MSTTGLSIIQEPPVTRLSIQDDVILIGTSRPLPNRWRRFWYWALLGWRWERIDGHEANANNR